MHTLESLRRTIDTANDLRSVVKTMKTLAAVSIRQYERAVEALSDYNRTVELAFQIVLRGEFTGLETHEAKEPTGAIVFGTDQGMCGQFNEEISAFVEQAQHNAPDWKLLVVGARAEARLAEAGVTMEGVYRVPTSVTEIGDLVEELLPQVEHWQTSHNLARLLVFYNRRAAAASYRPQQLQLLPIGRERFRQWSRQPWESRSLPTHTMDRRRLLACAVREYLYVCLFQACAESLSSENASRIAAMQSAEKNIEERLDQLQSDFNRLRQTAITEELLDVVGGFEALATSRGSRRRRKD